MYKILIIEDEAGIREGVVEILSYEDYEVHEAENGKKGIEKAKSVNPDLILCDIMMPEMNGFEVLTELKLFEQFNQIPFIFLTALGDRANTREGMNLGADDYLTKPFTKDELLDAITSKLEKYGKIINSFSNKIEQIEGQLNQELENLKGEIKVKEEEMMTEALKVIDTNNMLSTIKKEIDGHLTDTQLSHDERRHFSQLRNKIGQSSITSNNITLFQLKFNQNYPNFISALTKEHGKLSEYEILLASSISSGLNNHQVADLLCISPESARKSRYRLKKKLGLDKNQDLSTYIISLNT